MSSTKPVNTKFTKDAIDRLPFKTKAYHARVAPGLMIYVSPTGTKHFKKSFDGKKYIDLGYYSHPCLPADQLVSIDRAKYLAQQVDDLREQGLSARENVEFLKQLPESMSQRYLDLQRFKNLYPAYRGRPPVEKLSEGRKTPDPAAAPPKDSMKPMKPLHTPPGIEDSIAKDMQESFISLLKRVREKILGVTPAELETVEGAQITQPDFCGAKQGLPLSGSDNIAIKDSVDSASLYFTEKACFFHIPESYVNELKAFPYQKELWEAFRAPPFEGKVNFTEEDIQTILSTVRDKMEGAKASPAIESPCKLPDDVAEGNPAPSGWSGLFNHYEAYQNCHAASLELMTDIIQYLGSTTKDPDFPAYCVLTSNLIASLEEKLSKFKLTFSAAVEQRYLSTPPLTERTHDGTKE